MSLPGHHPVHETLGLLNSFLPLVRLVVDAVGHHDVKSPTEKPVALMATNAALEATLACLIEEAVSKGLHGVEDNLRVHVLRMAVQGHSVDKIKAVVKVRLCGWAMLSSPPTQAHPLQFLRALCWVFAELRQQLTTPVDIYPVVHLFKPADEEAPTSGIDDAAVILAYVLGQLDKALTRTPYHALLKSYTQLAMGTFVECAGTTAHRHHNTAESELTVAHVPLMLRATAQSSVTAEYLMSQVLAKLGSYKPVQCNEFRCEGHNQPGYHGAYFASLPGMLVIGVDGCLTGLQDMDTPTLELSEHLEIPSRLAPFSAHRNYILTGIMTCRQGPDGDSSPWSTFHREIEDSTWLGADKNQAVAGSTRTIDEFLPTGVASIARSLSQYIPGGFSRMLSAHLPFSDYLPHFAKPETAHDHAFAAGILQSFPHWTGTGNALWRQTNDPIRHLMTDIHPTTTLLLYSNTKLLNTPPSPEPVSTPPEPLQETTGSRIPVLLLTNTTGSEDNTTGSEDAGSMLAISSIGSSLALEKDTDDDIVCEPGDLDLSCWGDTDEHSTIPGTDSAHCGDTHRPGPRVLKRQDLVIDFELATVGHLLASVRRSNFLEGHHLNCVLYGMTPAHGEFHVSLWPLMHTPNQYSLPRDLRMPLAKCWPTWNVEGSRVLVEMSPQRASGHETSPSLGPSWVRHHADVDGTSHVEVHDGALGSFGPARWFIPIPNSMTYGELRPALRLGPKDLLYCHRLLPASPALPASDQSDDMLDRIGEGVTCGIVGPLELHEVDIRSACARQSLSSLGVGVDALLEVCRSPSSSRPFWKPASSSVFAALAADDPDHLSQVDGGVTVDMVIGLRVLTSDMTLVMPKGPEKADMNIPEPVTVLLSAAMSIVYVRSLLCCQVGLYDTDAHSHFGLLLCCDGELAQVPLPLYKSSVVGEEYTLSDLGVCNGDELWLAYKLEATSTHDPTRDFSHLPSQRRMCLLEWAATEPPCFTHEEIAPLHVGSSRLSTDPCEEIHVSMPLDTQRLGASSLQYVPPEACPPESTARTPTMQNASSHSDDSVKSKGVPTTSQKGCP